MREGIHLYSIGGINGQNARTYMFLEYAWSGIHVDDRDTSMRYQEIGSEVK